MYLVRVELKICQTLHEYYARILLWIRWYMLTRLYPRKYNLAMKVYTFRQDLKKRLKDPEFRKAWEESELEYQISRALISNRLKAKISQQQLAKKANTTQAVISRLEGMNANPSIDLLKRIAVALNLHLKIQLQ